MKIFIAWSGKRSQLMAQSLSAWLQQLFGGDEIDVFLSTELGPGMKWIPELEKKLRASRMVILCLTRENLDAYWIHYEAALVLGKHRDKSIAIPYCLDSLKDIRPPLSTFNALKAGHEGSQRLVKTIHDALIEDGAKIHGTPEIDFDKHWPELEEALEEIRKLPVPAEGIPALNDYENHITRYCDNSSVVGNVVRSIISWRSAAGLDIRRQFFPVFVCGSAAIGKSTFAQMLRDQINLDRENGLTADILPTDAYSLSRATKMKNGFHGYEPGSHDLDKLLEDFKALENGQSISVRPYDHITGDFQPQRVVQPESILIVEGVYSFYPSKGISEPRGLHIYIDADPPKGMELKFAADVMHRNYTVENAFDGMVNNYESYNEHIREPYLERGDMIIQVDGYWHYRQL